MRILLAVDQSRSSDLAISKVANQPWPWGSVVKVVTVEPPTDPSFLQGGETIFDKVIQQSEAEARRLLRRAVARIERAAPALKITSEILTGTINEAIIAEAQRWRAELIVVGSRDMSPLRKLISGSTSQQLARKAPCSVLIVRWPEGRESKALSTPMRERSQVHGHANAQMF